MYWEALRIGILWEETLHVAPPAAGSSEEYSVQMQMKTDILTSPHAAKGSVPGSERVGFRH